MQISGGRAFLAEGKARQGPKAGMCLRCLCLARWQNREEGGEWKGVRAVRDEVKERWGRMYADDRKVSGFHSV